MGTRSRRENIVDMLIAGYRIRKQKREKDRDITNV